MPEAFNGSVNEKQSSCLSHSSRSNQNTLIFMRPEPSMSSQSVVYEKDIRSEERYASHTNLKADIV